MCYGPRSARSICQLAGPCPALSSHGVSGADEQQRDTGGRRGWWLVGLLAVVGAAAGAFAGYRLDPDVGGLVPSLAAAGLGLGGLIGLLLLAPVGLWRAWRRRARRRMAAPERADLPDGTGLWHTADPEREAAPAAAAQLPGQAVIDAPAAEETEPERPEEPEAQALTPQEPLKPEPEEAQDSEAQKPRPEPQEPPPPARAEPGWYSDPAGAACAATGTATPGPGMSGVAAHGSARAKPAAAADADVTLSCPACLAAAVSVECHRAQQVADQAAAAVHRAVGAR